MKRKCKVAALELTQNKDMSCVLRGILCAPSRSYTYLWYAEQSQQIGHLYRSH